MVAWDHVTRDDVLRAIQEYDRLGPEGFFSEHGFAPTTTYELVWDERRYPPKAILGTAYEFATGQRLGSGDFEGGKTGAVRVLGKLGFTVQHRRRPQRVKLHCARAEELNHGIVLSPDLQPEAGGTLGMGVGARLGSHQTTYERRFAIRPA